MQDRFLSSRRVEILLALQWIRFIVLVLIHQLRESTMSRLTISISEARYRALKEASARRNKTIGQLIEESLELYGIKRARMRGRLCNGLVAIVA